MEACCFAYPTALGDAQLPCESGTTPILQILLSVIFSGFVLKLKTNLKETRVVVMGKMNGIS